MCLSPIPNERFSCHFMNYAAAFTTALAISAASTYIVLRNLGFNQAKATIISAIPILTAGSMAGGAIIGMALLWAVEQIWAKAWSHR